MADVSIEHLEEKCDSLYDLVIAAGRRATQLSKPENRPLVVAPHTKKPTVLALEEIMQGKVKVVRKSDEEEEYIE